MVKGIPLTQGKVALVDDEDYDKINQFKWSAHKMRNSYYASRSDRGPRSKRRKTILMHRSILNPKSNEDIDHKNSNGLDNRRCNIRIVTQSQNSMNVRRLSKYTSSKYKGVCWRDDSKNWRVRISLNGKMYYLGSFINEEDAARIYDEAAKKYFGEFARLNFPEELK